MVRRQHRDQRLDDGRRRVELAAALALGAGEHAQEVFVHLAQHVARDRRVFSRSRWSRSGPPARPACRRAVAREHSALSRMPEAGFSPSMMVSALSMNLPISGLFGQRAQVPSGSALGHPEHVGALVVVAVFQLWRPGLPAWRPGGRTRRRGSAAGPAPRLARGEGVADVFQEDQASTRCLYDWKLVAYRQSACWHRFDGSIGRRRLSYGNKSMKEKT